MYREGLKRSTKKATDGSILLLGTVQLSAAESMISMVPARSHTNPDVPGLRYTVYYAMPCPPPVFVCFITFWPDPSLFHNSALSQFCTKGFAADKGPLEFDSRVLGDLVLSLIV